MNISLITSAMSWVEFKINFKHNKRTCLLLWMHFKIS